MRADPLVARSGIPRAPVRRPAVALRPANGPVACLFYLTTFVLFGVSGGLLWHLGLNYDGLSGSAGSKIHPATYLGFALLGLVVVARRNPASFLATAAARHPLTLLFAALSVLQIAIIILQRRPNLATAFDTYLLPAFLLLAMSELDGRAIRRVEILIHVVMAVNAVMGLAEFALHERVFPYRFEGQVFETDTRSTALNGHPLANAAVTGSYILVLLVGGGPSLSGAARIAMTALQLAALVTFGGRTALVLVLAACAARLVVHALRLLAGLRVSLVSAIWAALLVPVAALVLVAIGEAGFFDSFTERFASDGGSAQARIGMLQILGDIPLRDLVVGPDSELVDTVRRLRGLEWGIENPVLRMLLYQGAIVTAFMVAGFGLFMTELGSRLRAGSWPVVLFFLLVINSFESLASKTTLLAKFVVMAAAMLAPRSDQSARPRRPSAATTSGSGLRSASPANSPNPSNMFQ